MFSGAYEAMFVNKKSRCSVKNGSDLAEKFRYVNHGQESYVFCSLNITEKEVNISGTVSCYITLNISNSLGTVVHTFKEHPRSIG